VLEEPLTDRLAGFEPAAWLLLLASPFIGSFLGVVIRRLPEGRPIFRGRSRCEHCGTALAARDLVPLLSWALIGGRCRHCRHGLGLFHPAVELAALAVAGMAVAVDPPGRALLGCVLGWTLLALGWIDLRRWLLPDVLTLPLLALGLAAATADPWALADRAAAALLGYGAFRAIAWTYERWRGREGLGQGDAKLVGAAGAWLGLAALPQVIFLAAALALAAAGILALMGRRIGRQSALPFGPFLALATWAIWLAGAFAPFGD